jgi:hypothetical protein
MFETNSLVGDVTQQGCGSLGILNFHQQFARTGHRGESATPVGSFSYKLQWLHGCLPVNWTAEY